MAARIFILVGCIVALIAAVLFFNNSGQDPGRQAKDLARAVVDECKRQMNDSLLSASTREAQRYMCNGLRNDYVAKYGSEP
jgi:gas vesicle protein